MRYNFEHFRFGHLAADVVGAWHGRGPQPGSTAPTFELPDTDGHVWRLEDHLDQPVLLHFGSYT